MQLKILFQFTSWQIKSLTSLMMIAVTIFVNNTKAQALGSSSAPDPGESAIAGGNEQGIEGLFNIIQLSDSFMNGDSLITISDEFRVDETMALPNPDNVIGDGNLVDVVNKAAQVWEAAFPEQSDILDQLNIGVGWANFDLNLNLILGDAGIPPRVTSNGLEIDGIAALYIHGDDNFPNTETVGFPEAPNLDGVIVFNSQPINNLDLDGDEERLLLYLDDDPFDSNIFGSIESETSRDLIDSNGNILNFGRSTFRKPSDFSEANDDDLVIDAFSVALHELQHALGLTRGNPDALDKLLDNDGIDNNGNRLVLGTSSQGNIPTTLTDSNSLGSLHIFDNLDDDFDDPDAVVDLEKIKSFTEDIFEEEIATPVAFEYVTNSERKCPSEADVLAIAEINGFENPVLNPCKALANKSVPEPSAIFPLIMVGIGGLLVGRKKLYTNQPS